jgi:hypothetical protein
MVLVSAIASSSVVGKRRRCGTRDINEIARGAGMIAHQCADCFEVLTCVARSDDRVTMDQ